MFISVILGYVELGLAGLVRLASVDEVILVGGELLVISFPFIGLGGLRRQIMLWPSSFMMNLFLLFIRLRILSRGFYEGLLGVL